MAFVTSRKGRPPIGKQAMTALECQQRRRAKLAKIAARKKESVTQRLAARAEYENRASGNNGHVTQINNGQSLAANRATGKALMSSIVIVS